MHTGYFDGLQGFGADALRTAREFEAFSARTFHKITEQQLDAINLCVETGAKQVSLFADGKDYRELVSGQAQLASETAGRLIEQARRSAALLTEVHEEFTRWLEQKAATGESPASGKTTAKKAA
jgi:phasin family protein